MINHHHDRSLSSRSIDHHHHHHHHRSSSSSSIIIIIDYHHEAQVKYRGHKQCVPVYETIKRIDETQATVEDGQETVIKRMEIA